MAVLGGIVPMLNWLIPYDFSPSLLFAWLAAALLYVRGARRRHVPFDRKLSYWSGMAIVYCALLTRFDFYALHQFFIDRIQQVLMHHLAPLLIAFAYPLPTLRAALPPRWRARFFKPAARSRIGRAVLFLLGHPWAATVTFVALVLLWLVPRAMTLAMLDWRLYWLMNVSMLASGLIYWSLVLDHRRRPPARMGSGMRVLSPIVSMTPQIVVGAVITFTKTDLYPVFAACGRVFDIDVLTDQQIGGLISWVPASMIETVAALLALRVWMRLSQAQARRASKRRAVPL